MIYWIKEEEEEEENGAVQVKEKKKRTEVSLDLRYSSPQLNLWVNSGRLLVLLFLGLHVPLMNFEFW